MPATYIAPIWAIRARDIRLLALTGQPGTCVRATTSVVTDMLGVTATLVNNQPRFQAIDTNADSINDALVFKGGAATTDYCKWTLPTLPILATYYAKLINRGAPGAPMIVLQQGFSGTPCLALLKTTGNAYQLYHHNGSAIVTSTAAASTSGHVIELRAVLRANGAVQLYLSTDGGAESAAAASGANTLAAAWSDTLLAMNGGSVGNSCDDDLFAAGVWLGEQTLASCQAIL